MGGGSWRGGLGKRRKKEFFIVLRYRRRLTISFCLCSRLPGLPSGSKDLEKKKSKEGGKIGEEERGIGGK